MSRERRAGPNASHESRVLHRRSHGEPIEEEFGGLFATARVLLGEDVAEEHRIIPTLALADVARMRWPPQKEEVRLVEDVEDPDAWAAGAEMFTWRHGHLRPVEAVDGLLILGREPVYVGVHDPIYIGKWSPKPPPREGEKNRARWDREAVIAPYTRPRPASAERVADLC